MASAKLHSMGNMNGKYKVAPMENVESLTPMNHQNGLFGAGTETPYDVSAYP